MLFSLRAATLSLVGCVALVAPAVASEGWIADFDEAVKIAKAEKKDLFVDFTGSDWCGWCKKLDAEVFSHEEFLTAAKKSFVLVALDFPRDEAVKAKVPNPKRNDELSSAAPFAAPAVDVSVTDWRGADSSDFRAAWDKLAEGLEAAKEGSVAAKLYVDSIRTAMEFDKDNKGGRKLRAVKLLLKSGNGDDAIFAAGRELDPKNENGLLELCVKAQFNSVRDDDGAKAALVALDGLAAAGPIKDKAVAFDLHVTAAYWCSQFLNDTDRAKKYAMKAKEIGTDDARALEFLDGIING
ncbi:MAG: thioredoxin family protein [Planctomycetota bacterium]|nr:thioredoxin family protein [Planctomycetota bacterium]